MDFDGAPRVVAQVHIKPGAKACRAQKDGRRLAFELGQRLDGGDRHAQGLGVGRAARVLEIAKQQPILEAAAPHGPDFAVRGADEGVRDAKRRLEQRRLAFGEPDQPIGLGWLFVVLIGRCAPPPRPCRLHGVNLRQRLSVFNRGAQNLVEAVGFADMEFAHILEAGQPRRGDPVLVARLHEALQKRLASMIGLDKGDHAPALQEDIVAGRPEGGGARRAKRRSSAKPKRMAIALAFDKKEWIAALFQAIEPVKRHALALRLIPDQLGVPLARHAIANAQETALACSRMRKIAHLKPFLSKILIASLATRKTSQEFTSACPSLG